MIQDDRLTASSSPAKSFGFSTPASVWLIMLVALLFTCLGWYLFNQYAEQRGRERFEYQAMLVKDAIRDRLLTYEQVLRGGVGLFMASDGVTREEWHEYVTNAKMESFYPGIQGIGYSVILHPEQLAAHEAAIRAEGFDEYRVYPAGERDTYQAIIYLEPFDWRNRRAFGYDMYSEPTRREAIDRAINTGEAAISGKITLVQETQQDIQAGFLMYLALYDESAAGPKAAKGVAYAAFRMNNLMQGILADKFPSLILQVFDGDTASDTSLLYSTEEEGQVTKTYNHVLPLKVGGHQWLLKIGADKSFVSETEKLQSKLMLGIGVLFIMVLFYFLLNNARARYQEGLLANEILANEKRFRLVIEASPSALIMVDGHGLITLVNAHTEQLFGYARDELLGRSVNILLPESLHKSHNRHMGGYLQQPIAKNMSQRDDLFGRAKDGSLVAVEVGLTPIHFTNGQSILATINDVSDRKRIEAEKARHTEELEKINRELDSFAYIASHDLKSPLRGIEQLSEWLAEDLSDNSSEQVQKYLRLIKSRVQRMVLLLDGLLTFSRIGRVDTELTEVDSKQLVQDTFSLVAPPTGFKLTILSDMPLLTTARVPLELVFRNLFSNAIKHHDKGEGVLSVSSERQGDYYCFCVTDDGPGIAAKFHHKIFAIFQTLRPRDEVEGSGLGLSLVKKSVENMGGKIWVKSEGRGCSFYFTWPAHFKEES
ncbi:histidine kinase [Shewanella algae]|nr:CHASE domain-containing protein [Shewanella algae]TWU68126.1 histidine kinase [Shewanella algae]